MELTKLTVQNVLSTVHGGADQLDNLQGERQTHVSWRLRTLTNALNTPFWSHEARATVLRRLVVAQLGTIDIDEQLLAESLRKTLITKVLSKILRTAAPLQKEPHKSMLTAAADQCETATSILNAAHGAIAARDKAYDGMYATGLASVVATYQDRPWTTGEPIAAAAAANRAMVAAFRVADEAAHENGSPALAVAIAAEYLWQHSVRALGPLLSEFASEVVQILVEMKTPGAAFLHLAQ